MSDFRILITGSRTWTDRERVRGALVKAAGVRHPKEVLVIHGGAQGADRIAGSEAAKLGYSTITRRARWRRADGSKNWNAGRERNEEMVMMLSPGDLCLAFMCPCDKPGCPQRGQHPSHGTAHCAGVAARAGVEVRRFYHGFGLDTWQIAGFDR